MRNALYQGNATKLLDRIAKSKVFKDATSNGLKPKRMKDKYIILRAIAFYLWIDKYLVDKKQQLIEYKGDIDDLLGKTMEYLNLLEEKDLIKIEEKFSVAMRNSQRVLGDDGFRLNKCEDGRKSPINMNVFEVLVYIMIILGERNDLDNIIKDKYIKLIDNEEFLDSIANHRDALNKVEDRFKMINKEFIEVILNDKEIED